MKKSILDKKNTKIKIIKIYFFIKDLILEESKIMTEVIYKSIILLLRKIYKFFFQIFFNSLTRENLFNIIYKRNFWNIGKNEQFYSGIGSRDERIIKPYTKKIKNLIKKKNYKILDLGTGDFNVSKKFYKYAKFFYAVDIVKPLIDRNKKKFKGKNLKFSHLDICKDKLPNANVYILRQVLQHLSNREIKLILNKLNKKNKIIIITEHSPSKKFIPNLDIKRCIVTRTAINSGVVIDRHPFNFKYKKKKKLLEVVSYPDLEKIITYQYNT